MERVGQGAGARLCTQLLRRLQVWKPPSAVPVTLDGPIGKLGTNQTTPVLAVFKRTMLEGHWGQEHIGLVDSQGPGWGMRRTQRAPGCGTTFWPKPSSHLPTSWWPSWNHLELDRECPPDRLGPLLLTSDWGLQLPAFQFSGYGYLELFSPQIILLKKEN